MTLQELFDYPYFTLLPARRKLLALGMLALAENGKCIGDPTFLKNVIFPVEADELDTAVIEDDLMAVKKALPIETAIEEDGKRFYRWVV